MTDLETLEKELQSLLEELIPDDLVFRHTYKPDYNAARQARLKMLLLERRILEVYDHIMKITVFLRSIVSDGSYNKIESYKKCYIGVTDYEWEWLKQQELKDN